MTLIRVCDGETTGFEDPAELVEIGWTDVHLTMAGNILIDPSGPRSKLVRPGLPISSAAMAVHHITEAMVELGDNPDECRAMLAYGADILCAHNARFDSRFIRGHNLPWICTLKAAKTAWPDMQSHGNGAIRYERGLCLNDTRALPAHRAGPDSWVTAHILADLLETLSVEQLVDISTKPVLQRRIGFGEHAGKPWSEVPDGYLDWILNKSTMPADPTKEDAVHTARVEVERRGLSDEPPSQSLPLPEPEPVKAKPEKGNVEVKGGRLAQRAGIICNEKGFWNFIGHKHKDLVVSANEARDWLCALCGVSSRRLLDHDAAAGQRFENVESEYKLWLDGYE